MADINGRSLEDVLNHYDFRATRKGFKPYFVVKASSQVKFSHEDDDVTAGRELLEENLKSAKMAGNTSVFSIIFYKRLDKNGECTGTGEVYNVRLNDPGQYSNVNAMVMPNMMGELKQTLETINGRLAALEEPEDDEDEEDDDGGFLGGITKDPEMKQALMRMLFQQMGLINPKQGYQAQGPINGVPDPAEEKEKIRTALQIMAKHTNSLGDDLMRLAKIAETDPNQFNFLLSMLRK